MKIDCDPRITIYIALIGTFLILLAGFAFWPSDKGAPISALDELTHMSEDTASSVFMTGKGQGFDVLSGYENGEDLQEYSLEYAYEEHGDLAVLPGQDTQKGKEGVLKEGYKTDTLVDENLLPPIRGKVPQKTYTLPPGEKAKVIIIIDDMGLDKRRTQAVMDLKAPLTLAFLPYAEGLTEMTSHARAQGHELMIHVPMEPLNENLNPGPVALLADMDEKEIRGAMKGIFTSFDGYVGINNHMGSKVTQSPEIMSWVMEELQKRGLLFVDSKTIGSSVAGEMADRYHLDHVDRDVFLDHYNSDEFVAESLQNLEHIALARGYAVAIGHPKDVTIRGLEAWLPTLEEKGLELVRVSAIAQNMKEVKVSASVVKKQKPMPETVVVSKDKKLPEREEELLSVDDLIQPHLR